MKWKNPDELRRLGFWVKGAPAPEDPQVDYELCLADDENAIAFEITVTFNRPPAPAKPTASGAPGPFVYAGAELRISKLQRQKLGGPFTRGSFVAARPLFFESFRDAETFLAALTGATPLFPESQEPLRKESMPEMQDLFRSALSVLHS